MKLWERIGLGRKELVGWALYDWANSAFYTVVVTAIYPLFFALYAVGGEGAETVATSRHAFATFLALLIVAILSPFLGAAADFSAAKKRFLALFLIVGVAATAGLVTVGAGDWLLSASLFVLANIGIVGSVVFYDSLLPHIASHEEVDRVSSAGFALGYLGGGLVLAAGSILLAAPDRFGFDDRVGAMKASFLLVAAWWLLFSLPLFRWVREPARRLEPDETVAQAALTVAWTRLRETFGELRRYRQAFLLLVAVMIYGDGIGTIIRMASIYGAEIGLPPSSLVGAILMIQFLGIPFTFLFGALAGRIGAKRSILLALSVYLLITVFGYFLRTATHFYVLAALVAMVQGGAQALSRSLFASVIPRHKSSEFFGFFAIFEKFAGTLGPLAFGLVVAATGSSRQAILAVAVFFLVGGALLMRVDVEEGRRVAREADAEVGGTGGLEVLGS